MASVKIVEKKKKNLKAINAISYAIINVSHNTRTVKVEEVLPFRVKFINIGIPNLISSAPGIGVAVIGFNNYIL